MKPPSRLPESQKENAASKLNLDIEAAKKLLDKKVN